MQSPGETNAAGLEDKTFLWLLVAVSVVFAWIIVPVSGAVLWGVFIAIVFWPIHTRLVRYLKRPNLAAFVSLALVVLIVILPLTVLSIAMASEASGLYDKIKSGEVDFGKYFQQVLDSLPSWAMNLLDRLGLSNISAVKEKLSAGISQGSQVVAVKAISIGQNTFTFLLNLFVMLYLLFFLLRDGQELYRLIRSAIPLRTQHKRALFEKFTVVVRATVKGNMVVALLQGGLGGLIFWILGIPAPVLWGAVMAILSLIPAVGAAMIWLPVAIYLLATGTVGKGVVLLVYGIVVISLVDNLVRPILVGKDTKMPDYLVLISTFGGIAIFGVNGFVIGPLIAAMFISVWDIFVKTEARRFE